MNNKTANNATNWPITLDNESTPDSTVFDATAPASTTSAAAAAISPDSDFLLSGLKLNTDLFKKGNINNMADKDKMDSTLAPNKVNDYNPDYYAQDDDCTNSNFLYSLRNRVPPTLLKIIKISKIKLMVKLQSTPSLFPTHPTLIPPMLLPKIMAPLIPILIFIEKGQNFLLLCQHHEKS